MRPKSTHQFIIVSQRVKLVLHDDKVVANLCKKSQNAQIMNHVRLVEYMEIKKSVLEMPICFLVGFKTLDRKNRLIASCPTESS